MQKIGLFGFLLTSWCVAAPAPSEVVSLPTESAWGGGDVLGSQLIGRTYNAGNGPGIWIVADGGYRLYLNGDLLAQDNQAGRVTFVPMTFLPGKNVVAVMGVDGNGAPGVLVQIDDLEKTHTSNATWKASVSITDNSWKQKTYNDAAWSSATATGTANTLPSGASLSGFATGSSAKWIWTSTLPTEKAVLRYTFEIKAEGFGAATTGGEGGSVVIATDSSSIVAALQSADAKIILIPEGTYDLRRFRNAVTEAIAAGRTWCKKACGTNDLNSSNTYYRVAFEANSCASLADGSTPVAESENLQAWSRWITTKPNKTLIGMGRGANLRGASIYMRSNEGASNQIYRNLGIYDVNPHLVEGGDGLSIVGTSANRTKKYWADHISYKWISDGLDLEYTTETTISWLDYDGRNHLNCYQVDPYVALVEDADVTYANSYWHGTMGRVPKVGSGTYASRVHMYNNYIDTNTYYMIGAEGKSTTANSQVLFENNAVNRATHAYMMKGANGFVRWIDNVQTNSTAKYYTNNVASTTAPTDAVFTPPYSYTKRTVSNLASENPQWAGVGGRWGAMPLYIQSFGRSNQAPTASLNSITTALTEPASVTLSASASDADGYVSSVSFYIGTTLVGTDNTAPYSLEVTGLTAGIYSVMAIATDNSGLLNASTFATMVVQAPVNSAPFFTGSDTSRIAENQTLVGLVAASDAEGDALTWSLATSSDSALFAIHSTTGELSFVSAPDFENPLDNNANNICHVMISVSDGKLTTTRKQIVLVTDVDEVPSLLLKSETPLNAQGQKRIFDLLGREQAK